MKGSKANFNINFKPVEMSEAERRKVAPSLYQDEDDMNSLIKAIETGAKKRNLEQDKFESGENKS